ncbi:acyltransferase family protein [Riemerella anatipestifer]|nr:acyltransferase family protein [Riemerella anatipestifer]
MKRDLYIDFAKGLATLSIIFIHTTFWSGQYYIPTELRVLSLLFDVPIFFALSGLTSGGNVEKTLYRLLKLQVTYMIFVTLLFFVDYFFKVFGLYFFGLESLKSFYATFGSKFVPQTIAYFPQWENLGNWYLHQYSTCDTFPVVMGSFWYLKVYYILTVLGVLVLRFFHQHINWFIILCFGLTLLFNIFPHYYPTGQVGYVSFYLGVFLVAHKMKGKRIKNNYTPLLYGALALVLVWMFWFYGADIFYKINKQKFPPRIPYIVWSFLSLITVFVLYNRLKITKDNFINYIGKNAIFYYFAQGISSSLVYFMVVSLQDNIHWGVLILMVYLVNVVLAIFIAELLKKIDALGWNTLIWLRRKTASAG